MYVILSRDTLIKSSRKLSLILNIIIQRDCQSVMSICVVLENDAISVIE